MRASTNPYQPNEITAGRDRISTTQRGSRTFYCGLTLTASALVLLTFIIFSLHSLFFKISSPIPAGAIPPKPAEIGAEIVFCSNVGYASAAICLPGLFLMISAFRKSHVQIPAHQHHSISQD